MKNEQLDTKINAANYQAFLESQQQMSKVNSINSMASMNSSINNMEGLGAMNSMNNSLNNISKVNNMNNLNAENMMPGMNQINSQNQVMPSNFPMQNQTMNGMTIPPQLNGNMNSNWMMPMDPNTAAAINYGSQYVNMNNQMNPMNGLINNLNQPQNIPGK